MKSYIDATKQKVICPVCGDSIPMPLGDIKWVVSVIEAFSKNHDKAGKNHAPGRTYFYSETSPRPAI